MCCIEKMNCIWIRKREDRVPDPVHTLGRVGYWGVSPHTNPQEMVGFWPPRKKR